MSTLLKRRLDRLEAAFKKPADDSTGKEDSKLNDLRIHHAALSQDGAWDWDAHSYGWYCGLELAIATLEGRDPSYKTPQVWGCNGETANPSVPSFKL